MFVMCLVDSVPWCTVQKMLWLLVCAHCTCVCVCLIIVLYYSLSLAFDFANLSMTAAHDLSMTAAHEEIATGGEIRGVGESDQQTLSK